MKTTGLYADRDDRGGAPADAAVSSTATAANVMGHTAGRSWATAVNIGTEDLYD